MQPDCGSTACIEEKFLTARFDQRANAKSVNVEDRRASAEQRHLDFLSVDRGGKERCHRHERNDDTSFNKL